jgi:hypothetical protein
MEVNNGLLNVAGVYADGKHLFLKELFAEKNLLLLQYAKALFLWRC